MASHGDAPRKRKARWNTTPASTSSDWELPAVEPENGRKDRKVAVNVKPIHEYLASDNMVTIYVGEERKRWIVHEDLLCDNVELFRAAFKSNFKEGLEKTMELPDDDPIAFGYLIGWLYTKEIVCSYATHEFSENNQIQEQQPGIKSSWTHTRGKKSEDEEKSEMEKKPEVDEKPVKICNAEHDLQWCCLWVLADKLMLPELCAMAILQYELREPQTLHAPQSSCTENCPWTLPAEVITYTFEHAPEGSEIRQALVNRAVAMISAEVDLEDSNLVEAFAASKEFCAEVMIATRDHNKMEPQHCHYNNCVVHNLYCVIVKTGSWVRNNAGTASYEGQSLFSKWTTLGWKAGRNREDNPGQRGSSWATAYPEDEWNQSPAHSSWDTDNAADSWGPAPAATSSNVGHGGWA